MNKILKKLLDYYLYSNLHIAIGAALSVIGSYSILIHIPDSNYPLMVFFGTVLVYSIHRIVGSDKLKTKKASGRFEIIKKHRKLLFISGFFSSIGCLYFFLTLDYHIQLLLIIPIIISILYILPIFKERKRLRDIQFIKIFLISFVWSILIGTIPYYESQGLIDWTGIIFSLEIFLFIFAITIPFDIRDLAVDRSLDVTTIPELIGIKNSYLLSYILLILAVIFSIYLHLIQLFSTNIGIALLIAYILTVICIEFSRNKKSDYYYSGLLDGTIILRAFLVIIFSGILSVIF